MKKLCVLYIFLSINLFAQLPDFSKEVQAAMSNVSVMAGKWEGDGWRSSPKGEKSFSHTVENIEWKLDKTLLVLEGLGKKEGGQIVHNAYGVLSFNPNTDKYSLKTFLSSGLSTDANFEVVEPNKIFRWWFEDNRGGTIQYTITNDGSTWNEIGEYSMDKKQWKKFFEMNLKKVE